MLKHPLRKSTNEDVFNRLDRALKGEDLNDKLHDLYENCGRLEKLTEKCFSIANGDINRYRLEVEKLDNSCKLYQTEAKRLRLGGGCIHGADHGPECYLCLEDTGRLNGEYVGFADGLDVADFCFRYLDSSSFLTNKKKDTFLNLLDDKSATLKLIDAILRRVSSNINKLFSVLQQKSTKLKENTKSIEETKPKYTTESISDIIFRLYDIQEEENSQIEVKPSTLHKKLLFSIGPFVLKLIFQTAIDNLLRRIDIKGADICLYITKEFDLFFFLEEIISKLSGLKCKIFQLKSKQTNTIIDNNTFFKQLESLDEVIASDFKLTQIHNFQALNKTLSNHRSRLGFKSTKRTFLVDDILEQCQDITSLNLNNLNFTFSDVSILLCSLKYSVFSKPIKLNLSGNDLNDTNFYSSLIDTLKDSIQLEELDLSFNSVANDSVGASPKQLLDLLEVINEFHIETIHSLNMNSCGILLTEDKLKQFSEIVFTLLINCSKLEIMDLSYIYDLNPTISYNDHSFTDKIRLGFASCQTIQQLFIDGITGINSEIDFKHT